MASARSVINRTIAPPERVFGKYKRMGAISKAEKEMVAQFVLDQPGQIDPKQVNALARTMRRSRDAVKAMIEQARENFVTAGERYVEIHRQATEDALASGTVAGLKAAQEGAQWAMENISAEGARIVDKAKSEPSGQRVFVGIRIGGANDPAAVQVEEVKSDE